MNTLYLIIIGRKDFMFCEVCESDREVKLIDDRQGEDGPLVICTTCGHGLRHGTDLCDSL